MELKKKEAAEGYTRPCKRLHAVLQTKAQVGKCTILMVL